MTRLFEVQEVNWEYENPKNVTYTRVLINSNLISEVREEKYISDMVGFPVLLVHFGRRELSIKGSMEEFKIILDELEDKLQDEFK